MTTLNKVIVKSAMVRDKGFLKDLYTNSGPQNLKRLKNAQDSQIQTLIKVLHFITVGAIDIKRDHFDALLSGKKLAVLRKLFESKKKVIDLLKSSREMQINVLKKFVNFYALLLHSLFNRN